MMSTLCCRLEWIKSVIQLTVDVSVWTLINLNCEVISQCHVLLS